MTAEDEPFRLEEATIDELHEAIKAGRTTCVAVVRHYIERARAYNGVASVLVTEEGMPVPEATGAVRAVVPLRFPTETVEAATILPDLDSYREPPLEFGRMEATVSDPSVQQQYGMIVGKCDAGQLPITIPEPGLPFSLVFRAEPGREDVILQIASAYEAGSKRRIHPPAFGPVRTRSPGVRWKPETF